jgi:hypothetical protein
MASKRVHGVLGKILQRQPCVPCHDAAVAGTVIVVGHREGGLKRRPFSQGCARRTWLSNLRRCMTTVRRQHDRHGGTVRLGSEKGKGTTFSHWLGTSSHSRAPSGPGPRCDGAACQGGGRLGGQGRRGENKAWPCGRRLGAQARARVLVAQDRGVAMPCAGHRRAGPATRCSSERATAAVGNMAARWAPTREGDRTGDPRNIY